jgi:DNA-directed RNA polymerase specialized sigma24 family protein
LIMQSNPKNLNEMITHWSLVLRAVASNPDAAALAEVLPKYCQSVNQYLRAVLQDPNAADEVCQEFAYRFARGDFRHVRPENGRFRDYIKVSILRMVQEYRRKAKCNALREPLDPDLIIATNPDSEKEFDASHRTVLIERTWQELEHIVKEEHPNLYDVLRRKAESPERTSAELAAQLTAEFGKPLTAVNVRQMLHRAREQFSTTLRHQVAVLQPGCDEAAIDEELAGLGLLSYCLPGPG